MSIREQITAAICEALHKAQQNGDLPLVNTEYSLQIEQPQKAEHGDYATSLPLKLAKPLSMPPMVIAESIVKHFPNELTVERVWAEGPGFVNFALSSSWLKRQVDEIRRLGTSFGNSNIGKGAKVQVEFVSVNPTGPLHVGHARGAVIGSALANILKACGYKVLKEYYINDAGVQIDLFARSLRARYMELFGKPSDMPPDGYLGAYMVDLATSIHSEFNDRFLDDAGDDTTADLGELGLAKMIEAIRRDLNFIGVEFDVWFSERSLFTDGQYDESITALKTKGFLTKGDGATWFSSTALGEDKDNVLVRSTGVPTYFASDVAYHYDKFKKRGFDLVVDIWGADHHGHVPRMKAAVEALGIDPNNLVFIISQLVTLKRGDEVVRVSKRTGDIITLRELVDEVGKDACRFFFLSRSPESQMEFDMVLAKQQSTENPVYYVQYAHARIASILRVADESGLGFEDGDTSLLTNEAEIDLIRKMVVFPDLVQHMANNMEPHHLPHYSMELATSFHLLYQQCRILSDDPNDADLTMARLKLVDAAKTVLARCLNMMVMTAPDKM